ncbi:transcription repressor OFP14-like [Amaranthus tricolor]|uniref:transcription repressor OFP14-like n=1 Tax=Amaranthus tricolor TaxID=29722 RepID=UPI00258F600E|nr:transcription repressor OFP14-like [Amaranthus tricolor]
MKLQKSLQEYLPKIKKQTPSFQFSPSSFSSTTSKILAGCKHSAKNFSFKGERKGSQKNHLDDQLHNEEAAATLEDIDRFLIENFKSLYGEDHGNNNDDNYEFIRENEKLKGFFTPPPDLCGSHRFFVSPVSSSSLLEEARLSGLATTSTSEDARSTLISLGNNRGYIKDDTLATPPGIEDCIALPTVSPTPYEDFRRSMQEMLDARINSKQRVDWDFLEELLFCYLRLNEKKQYKYIISAFVDLIVVLRQNSSNRGPVGSLKIITLVRLARLDCRFFFGNVVYTPTNTSLSGLEI